MLHSFSVSNFGSIKDEETLSFVIRNDEFSNGWEHEENGQAISMATALLGANGSGKSTILRALAFSWWFALNSFHSLAPEQDIPVEGWFDTDAPSTFRFKSGDGKGNSHAYTLILTQNTVIAEALEQNGKTVFQREDKKGKPSVNRDKRFKNFKNVPIENIRRNCSFLSTALQYNAALPFVNEFFFGNVNYAPHLPTQSMMTVAKWNFRNLHENKKTKHFTDIINRHIRSLNAGVDKIDFRKTTTTDENTGQTKSNIFFYGVHTVDGGEKYIPLANESDGTQLFFAYMVFMIHTLMTAKQSGFIVIDEIERHLHPLLVEKVIELFDDPEANPKNIQLIFSTHIPDMIDYLGPAHIVFAEKKNHISTFRSLEAGNSEYIEAIRKQTTLSQAYLSGMLGGLPDIESVENETGDAER